jgi:DNA-binding winged helix-turn-helix (wHTH) protein
MPRIYFGEFSAELDSSHCHQLFRGYEPVALSDTPRRVLFILLRERPMPVVAKVLLQELWPPGANASNLAKQVKALRVALRDENPGRYIRTLNKEGYAFVMPAADSAPAGSAVLPGAEGRRTSGAEPTFGSSLGGACGQPSEAEWHLAQEKLFKDFRGSCLHDIEQLTEAIEECDGRIQLIADKKGLPLDGRFPRERVLLPPRRLTRRGGPTAEGVDGESAARAAALVDYSQSNPIVINVGAYSPACIAVLHSLRRRYGLVVRSDYEGLSGRQQILRLFHDDEADFLFAPHVPLLLVGDYGALDYRRVTPVHSYSQVVLRAPGRPRSARPRLLVYKGGYPEEQMMTEIGIPDSAEPELVGSLERLVEKVTELSAGDMVIAWEPLASGLTSQHRLERRSEYRCWVSLHGHARWHKGALSPLKLQFTQLFASEWVYCRQNLGWALECLGMELRALELFTAGSGLVPSA